MYERVAAKAITALHRVQSTLNAAEQSADYRLMHIQSAQEDIKRTLESIKDLVYDAYFNLEE